MGDLAKTAKASGGACRVIHVLRRFVTGAELGLKPLSEEAKLCREAQPNRARRIRSNAKALDIGVSADAFRGMWPSSGRRRLTRCDKTGTLPDASNTGANRIRMTM